MKIKLTKSVMLNIAKSCILILSITIIGCTHAVPPSIDNTFYYKPGPNEVCTYKVITGFSCLEKNVLGNCVKQQNVYIHYGKVCTEYGTNVVKIMDEKIAGERVASERIANDNPAK